MTHRWGVFHITNFYKYDTPMRCYFISLIFYGELVACEKLLIKPSSTGSSRRDEIFVNKTIIFTPPCRGGILNSDAPIIIFLLTEFHRGAATACFLREGRSLQSR